ncbi:MAG: type I restriction enzyme HsdR N-terminal domain-containing protein [Cytophagales bacterium]|nr:MAG: type I restriction enzyme HsdR N-terminal domain-containing protein [Cytophagales bacterium]TAF59892.1 MAG: type I restriction enzyme HsdR N-terminal domain-containing protein [Cytophagales bacterium]
MNLPNLNLPLPALKLKLNEYNEPLVWDVVRKSYVKLTPEEWVRQHFLHFLLLNGYPSTLIQVENKLPQHKKYGRTDLLAYDRQARPFLLVECKAPEQNIEQSSHFQQILAYNTRLGSPFLALTNGMTHLYIQQEKGKLSLLNDLPSFPRG